MNPLDRKRLSISSTYYPSGNSNLDGLSLDIFFQGCNKHCKNCHNPELWSFKEPNRSINELGAVIKKAENVDIITFVGGDPIDSLGLSMLHVILQWIRNNFNKKVCLYTYKEFNEIPKEILGYIDYIKTGEYDEKQKTKAGSFLASSNQKMWKKNNIGKWFVQWEYNKDSKEVSW